MAVEPAVRTPHRMKKAYSRISGLRRAGASTRTLPPLGGALRESADLMTASLTHPDFKEGVNSYVEKRPPRFARVTVPGDGGEG